MTYKLRNFENNFQAVSSLGWIIVAMSLLLFFIKGMPGFLIFTMIGGLLIWWQLRGKRVIIDVSKRTIKKGLKTISIESPLQIIFKETSISQRVNSRVSSTTVQNYFYKAFLEMGEQKILISSNRKESRDFEKLKLIASDLGIDFVKV